MKSEFPTLEELNIESHRRQSYIKKTYPEFEQYIINNFKDAPTWSEKLYWYYHDLTCLPKCALCGNPVKFEGIVKGYRLHCSRKCNNNDKDTLDGRKQIFLNKYGVEYPTQNESVKNKIKQTNLEKYGVESPFQSAGFNDKRKETCINKYGVEFAAQSEIVKNKSKETCISKYGVEYYNQSFRGKDKLSKSHQTQEYQDKIHKIYKNKYGCESLFQSEEVKEKIKQTNLKNLGVENPFQSEGIKDKIKQTNLERYGTEYPLMSQIIKDKVKQANIEKYGCENYAKSEEFQSRKEKILNKVKLTCLERYGSKNYTQSQDYQSRRNEIQSKINNTKRSNNTFNTSKIEEEFASYLDQNHIIYKRQYKSDLYPFNCDFYLPDYELYIEIQGSWTHGHHPYNIETDRDKLELWKAKNSDYYRNAIEVWTKKDPVKRETAKLNNLNYLEIFFNNIDEVIKQFEEYINKKHIYNIFNT